MLITHIIMAINVVIFILMVSIGGASSITDPSIHLLLSFGASSRSSVFEGGEIWRLLASNYIHIGLPHLLFNMWCLYSIGEALEYYMGSMFFVIIYTASGIIGSLASCLYYFNSYPSIVSAGASGAVFGIAGALLVTTIYLRMKYGKSEFNFDYSSIIFFIGFNIVYGLNMPGIDNACHMGGLFSGMLLGLLFSFVRDAILNS